MTQQESIHLLKWVNQNPTNRILIDTNLGIIELEDIKMYEDYPNTVIPFDKNQVMCRIKGYFTPLKGLALKSMKLSTGEDINQIAYAGPEDPERIQKGLDWLNNLIEKK